MLRKGDGKIELVVLLMILGILAYEVYPVADNINAMTIDELKDALEFAKTSALSACVFGIPVTLIGLFKVFRGKNVSEN